MKFNNSIEIVSSTRPGLSSMSQASREAILGVLTKHYASVKITIINTVADLEALAVRQPDLVFLGMKFIPLNPSLGFQDPDKIWIAEYLEERAIAYTGSGSEAHKLELSKPLAKQCILDAGLRTSPFYVAKKHQPVALGDLTLRFPLFIKPTDRGGGLGVDSSSVVHNLKQLQSKVESVTRDINSDSLIEEYLPGREISVAILKDTKSDELLFMPIERVVPPNEQGVRILSSEIKHADAGLSVMVADGQVKTDVMHLAMNVFQALGARDYGRIDIRLDEAGTPHFLEANLIPSLIKNYGNFPKACVLNLDLDYVSMILRIVELGMNRKILSTDVLEPETSLGLTPPLLEVV